MALHSSLPDSHRGLCHDYGNHHRYHRALSAGPPHTVLRSTPAWPRPFWPRMNARRRPPSIFVQQKWKGVSLYIYVDFLNKRSSYQCVAVETKGTAVSGVNLFGCAVLVRKMQGGACGHNCTLCPRRSFIPRAQLIHSTDHGWINELMPDINITPLPTVDRHGRQVHQSNKWNCNSFKEMLAPTPYGISSISTGFTGDLFESVHTSD